LNDVTKIARSVYEQMSEGVESAAIAALVAKQPPLDEFDARGYAVSFGAAWALALAADPEASPGALAAIATEAADMTHLAQSTVGGWDASRPGRNAVPPKSEKPAPGRPYLRLLTGLGELDESA